MMENNQRMTLPPLAQNDPQRDIGILSIKLHQLEMSVGINQQDMQAMTGQLSQHLRAMYQAIETVQAQVQELQTKLQEVQPHAEPPVPPPTPALAPAQQPAKAAKREKA